MPLGAVRRLCKLGALTALASPAIAQNAMTFEFAGWQPIFRGVELGVGRTPDAAFGVLEVRALRLDLREPTLDLFVTPGNGEEPKETQSQTASLFLDQHALAVAVNASFFSPCCSVIQEPKDLIGLLVSEGVVVSPPVAQGTGAPVIAIDAGRSSERRAHVFSPEELFASEGWSPDALPVEGVLSTLDSAAAGSHRLLQGGLVVAPADAPSGMAGPNPRTAAGVTADGSTLLLITIDGRQSTWSNGATLRETAEWLAFLGAHDAINLDGGGSTTMVRRGADGEPELINRPVGIGVPNTQRMNGSHIGAKALPAPRPLGDFDADGRLRIQDLLSYLASFRARARSTDLDASGTIDVQDLLAFLASYREGFRAALTGAMPTPPAPAPTP